MPERRSLKGLIGGWVAYWAVAAAVKLGPAIAVIYGATQGSEGKGSFSINFGDGALTLTVIENGATTYTGSASLLEVAAWVAGPPLLWWIVWAMRRRKAEGQRESARV